MLENLSGRFQDIFKKLRGHSRLTEGNIKDSMREIRLALLEADVNFKVVKQFVKDVTERAIGQEVIKSISPGQQVVKVVQDEMTKLMGPEDATLSKASGGPTIIMMAGLQGAGKTTTCAKLAKFLQSKGHSPMMVAADIQRPAAIEQLITLGKQTNVPVYSEENSRPVKICRNSIEQAKENNCDYIILDTAGRLHIDIDLMTELKQIAKKVSPHEILLVCDAMTGQDAVNSAKEFNEQLEITGVLLTKLDGDARGGAALSIKAVTGKPIKFIGVGEKTDKLEPFHPNGMASRILGMGDIVSLVEKAQTAVNEEDALRMKEKLEKNAFTLQDWLEQMQKIKQMGSIKDLLSMMPGMGNVAGMADVSDDEMKHTEAIILSMTAEERQNPTVIDGSRRMRIAKGSGTNVQDVNQLLKGFKQMKKMMKGFSKGKFKKGKMPMDLPF